MALERGQNCMLGARAGALEGVAGEDLLPGPRDEDDVRVEAQWQEHVSRSNLVSGVSARVEGRGTESLPLYGCRRVGALGRAFGGVRCSSAVLFHVHRNNLRLPLVVNQCPGGIP